MQQSDPEIQQKIDQSPLYEEALEAYFKHDIFHCYEILKDLKQVNSHDVALSNYMDRCAEMLEFDAAHNVVRQRTPEDFDPVFKLSSK